MAEESVAQHRVIAALVQEQLPAMTQAQIRLAVLVDVWRAAVRSRLAEEIEDTALADIEEKTNILLASRRKSVSCRMPRGMGEMNVLPHVLL